MVKASNGAKVWDVAPSIKSDPDRSMVRVLPLLSMRLNLKLKLALESALTKVITILPDVQSTR